VLAGLLYPPETNKLLAALPALDYQRLRPALEVVPLVVRHPLSQPEEPVPYVYFPRSGLVSLLLTMEDGRVVETGLVGSEGMVGLFGFLGTRRSAEETVVQIAGEAARLEAGILREQTRMGGVLCDLLLRYIEALFFQAAQALACCNLHLVEQRCARWLLTAQDRTGEAVLPLTHQTLADMLGVRRASVSTTLEGLQQAGLIRAQMGRITVRDRAGLEKVACECDGLIRQRFADLVPGPTA
jgi:CRP-like cAMP-binding protein